MEKCSRYTVSYQIGGGAVVLGNHITEINKEENEYPFRFISPEDSVWMISRAYYKILLMYLKSKGIVLEVAITTE